MKDRLQYMLSAMLYIFRFAFYIIYFLVYLQVLAYVSAGIVPLWISVYIVGLLIIAVVDGWIFIHKHFDKYGEYIMFVTLIINIAIIYYYGYLSKAEI